MRKWWNKRSKTEKTLLGIGGTILAVGIGYGLYTLGKKIGISRSEEVNKFLSDKFDMGFDAGVVSGRTQELYNFTEPNLGCPDQTFLLKYFNIRLVKVSKDEAEKILNEVDPLKEMQKFLENKIEKGMNY